MKRTKFVLLALAVSCFICAVPLHASILGGDVSIENIISFFDASVADQTLLGTGPGASADGRRNAYRNMLTKSKYLIDHGILYQAYDQLMDAQLKADDNPNPPDFLAGSSVETLFRKISGLSYKLKLPCVGDLDGDNDVDDSDMETFRSCYETNLCEPGTGASCQSPPELICDLDANGIITQIDNVIINYNHLRKYCPLISPTEACCLSSGSGLSCLNLTPDECSSQGVSQGPYSDCAFMICGVYEMPSGGCCLTDGSCTILSDEDCTTLGGVSLGGGTCMGDYFIPNGIDDRCEY
jgi:hypothetical protein